MDIQQPSKRFKDLPLVNAKGPARLPNAKRLVIAGMFFVTFCTYHTSLFRSHYRDDSPTYYAQWRILNSSFPTNFWWQVAVVLSLVPYICSIAGFFIFTFLRNANKKAGLLLCIISLVSLEIWHYSYYRNFGIFYKEIIEVRSVYWVLFILFVLVTVFCWERRRKEI